MEILNLKNKLNDAKKYLENKKINNNYDQMLKNSLKEIIDKYNNNFKKKLKIKNIVITRGWLKFYELIFHINEKSNKIFDINDIFFNCEFPGGGIIAVNYYYYNYNIDLKWKASSYTENKDCLKDSFNLYKNFNANWCFNISNGDMTNDESINKIIDVYKNSFSIFFSDGAIDIKDLYSDQENLNFNIIQGSCKLGYNLLKLNGIMIIKFYTFFENKTRLLIYEYSKKFEYVQFFKPLTSNKNNSEIYVIFYHKLNNYLNIKYNDFNKSLINEMKIIVNKQIYNLEKIKNMNVISYTLDFQYNFYKTWISKYFKKNINLYQKLKLIK